MIVSFFGLAAAWRVPKFSQTGWRPLANCPVSRAWISAARLFCGLCGLLLLGAVAYSGLFGTASTDRNFAVTFVFVTVWIGGPVLSALVGNALQVFNPWRSIGQFGGFIYRKLLGDDPVHLAYPERLGRWPAAITLIGFIWLEIVFGSELSGAVLTPQLVGFTAIGYSFLTLSMISVFGTKAWCRNGELFSVLFGMFATLSCFESRHGRVGRRRVLSGTFGWAGKSGSSAFVLAAISGTTYDGAQQGLLLGPREWLAALVGDLGVGSSAAAWTADTTMLLMIWLIVGGIYQFGVWGMRRLPNSPSFSQLKTDFAHSLIPIALAYLIAHYFSYFVERIQAQFTYLISDPLGRGWDLFGTVDFQVNSDLFGDALVWYLQLAVLLCGHVIGLILAHDRSLMIWKNVRVAARSQYWMLVVMVFLTVFGLYLLSSSFT